MASTGSGATKPPSEDHDDEFLIAADLTLYANPLRCLQPKKTGGSAVSSKTNQAGGKDNSCGDSGETKEGSETTGSAKASNNNSNSSSSSSSGSKRTYSKGTSDQSDRYDNDANTMIAADLVKYGSPLDG